MRVRFLPGRAEAAGGIAPPQHFCDEDDRLAHSFRLFRGCGASKLRSGFAVNRGCRVGVLGNCPKERSNAVGVGVNCRNCRPAMKLPARFPMAGEVDFRRDDSRLLAGQRWRRIRGTPPARGVLPADGPAARHEGVAHGSCPHGNPQRGGKGWHRVAAATDSCKGAGARAEEKTPAEFSVLREDGSPLRSSSRGGLASWRECVEQLFGFLLWLKTVSDEGCSDHSALRMVKIYYVN